MSWCALYYHLGPYGDQNVHVHPPFEERETDFALIGPGRTCDGDRSTHVVRKLPVEAPVFPLAGEESDG